MKRFVGFTLVGIWLAMLSCSSGSSNNYGSPGGAAGQAGAPGAGGAAGGTGTPGTFSLTVKVTSFAPHVGQKIVAWVYLLPDKTKVGEGTIASLPSPDDSMVIPGILDAGSSYQIDLWADLNGNGTCDPPPADHSWRLTAADITGDTTVEQVHDATTLVAVCGAAGNPTP
jgi:hypothetical protein